MLAYIMSLLPPLVPSLLTLRIRVSHSLYVCSILGGRPLQMKVPSKVPMPRHSVRLIEA